MKPLPKADRHGGGGENDRRAPVQRDMQVRLQPRAGRLLPRRTFRFSASADL